MSETTQLDRIEAKVDRLLKALAPKRPGEDGKIFKDPKEKYWAGESYAGYKFSECPATYLRAFAKYKGVCVWAANEAFKKSKDPKELQYTEKNSGEAKLAIAWAEYREALGDDVPAPTPIPCAEPDDFGAPVDADIPY